jgi:peroxiredoxin
VTGRLRRALVTAIAATMLLAGCASDPLAEQYREGSGKGYIAGDGSVSEIPEAQRGEPISFTGTTELGEKVSSDDFTGQVVVVNFWYASCAPCRAEAPDLQALNEQFVGARATFLGVNVRDQAPSAIAFAENYGITYPSVIDSTDGSMQLSFSGSIPPNAVPTTLVLDASGRVAARILGQVSEASILETLIRDTIAESE